MKVVIGIVLLAGRLVFIFTVIFKIEMFKEMEMFAVYLGVSVTCSLALGEL